MLHWNLTKIDSWKDVCEGHDGQMHAITNGLIMLTMCIDMGEITEKNYLEFFTRIDILQKLRGCLFTTNVYGGTNYGAPPIPMLSSKFDDPTGYVVTVEDIKAHIGLTTNVSTKRRTSFLSRMFRHMLDDAKELEKSKLKKETVPVE